jgi:hypothetical protein
VNRTRKKSKEVHLDVLFRFDKIKVAKLSKEKTLASTGFVFWG